MTSSKLFLIQNSVNHQIIKPIFQYLNIPTTKCFPAAFSSEHWVDTSLWQSLCFTTLHPCLLDLLKILRSNESTITSLLKSLHLHHHKRHFLSLCAKSFHLQSYWFPLYYQLLGQKEAQFVQLFLYLEHSFLYNILFWTNYTLCF